MEIRINEKGSEAFYKETVNVTLQYRGLMKKPEKTPENLKKKLTLYMIGCGVLGAALLVMGFAWGFDTLTVVAIALMGFVLLLAGTYLSTIRKAEEAVIQDMRSSVLTLDEKGIELNKEDSQVVRIGWNNIAFARVFQESICFFSKDQTGLVIAVDRKYQDEILRELKQNHPEVRLIGA
ncbi:MAG: hypothetical protein IJL43_03045 [Lachnospiraceae bacterium]|nr:hypothetical protein [Lachnospiraceae bacterium]